MTTLRLALVSLLASVGLVVATPVAALACSCAALSVADQVASADAVFTGTLVDVRQPPWRPVMSSGDPVTYRFDVDGVRKGDVPQHTEITSARDGASCGLEGLRVGSRYVVFAHAAGTELSANLCGGTQELSAELSPQLDGAAGAARQPRPGELRVAISPSSAERWAAGALAGLVVVTGWIGLRAIRRRSA